MAEDREKGMEVAYMDQLGAVHRFRSVPELLAEHESALSDAMRGLGLALIELSATGTGALMPVRNEHMVARYAVHIALHQAVKSRVTLPSIKSVAYELIYCDADNEDNVYTSRLTVQTTNPKWANPRAWAQIGQVLEVNGYKLMSADMVVEQTVSITPEQGSAAAAQQEVPTPTRLRRVK